MTYEYTYEHGEGIVTCPYGRFSDHVAGDFRKLTGHINADIVRLTAARDEYKRRLDAVVETVEADARAETTALVQAVRAIAENRDDG